MKLDKIALISDVHGNMAALETVLEDIRRHDITRIFCLGDIVGKGPNSDLTLDLVRKHCELTVKGNWDDFISKESEYEVARWHQRLLGDDRLSYLRDLPFSIEFMMSGKYIRLFHASPRSVYERIQPWDDYDQRLSLFEYSEFSEVKRPADVAGYGDIHGAYLQNLEGKVLFNAGSVGNPLDSTQASYVVLEGVYNSTSLAPLNVHFMRIPYDIELAVKQAVESHMPALEPYIEELRTGNYRGKTS